MAAKRSYDDPEREQRRLDALAMIRQYGEPVLRTACETITVFDQALREEAARMVVLMRDARGVGLAAPQVGRLSRLIVVSAGEDDGAYALCNPRIVARSEEEEIDTEGCLSIGEISVPVSRAVSVSLDAEDLDGETMSLTVEGFEARVIQHEMDHLDGILILDRTTPEDRREALRELRESMPLRA